MAADQPPPTQPEHGRPVLSRVAVLIALGGALATAAIVLRAAAPWEAPAGSWFGLTALAISALSPYAFLGWVARRLPRTAMQGAVALAGASLVTGFGLTVLLDLLVLNPALLHALALLAVPPIQWLGSAALLAILLTLRRVQRPANPAPPP